MPRPSRTLQALIVLTAFGVLAFAAATPPPAPAGWVATPAAPWLDTSDRDVVLDSFRAEFAAVDPEMGWHGDQGSCDPGSNSADYREATLRRVNFYRAMAGVPGDVVDDPAYSKKAQRAAVMMSAQGELTHNPDRAFACFTDIGQEAAANSNLYLGRTGPSAVDGYIEDPGAKNIDVGHRATILHPPTGRMGVGDVGSSAAGAAANALWVFDDRVFDEEAPSRRRRVREADRFVAWPPRGYVPAVLVHPRWSFTLAGADFTGADVSVYRLGSGASAADTLVPVTVVHRSGAIGHVPLPTIVWEPDLGGVDGDNDQHGVASSGADETFLVLIENVAVDGATRSFGYEVRALGNEPGDELTLEEFVARLGS